MKLSVQLLTILIYDASQADWNFGDLPSSSEIFVVYREDVT